MSAPQSVENLLPEVRLRKCGDDLVIRSLALAELFDLGTEVLL